MRTAFAAATSFCLLLGLSTSDAAESQGFIGVQVKLDADAKNVFVLMVQDGGPADKAGLKMNDVLLKIGDLAVETPAQFAEAVRKNKPGTEVTIRIRRDGKEQDIKVTPAELPKSLDQ